MINKKSKRNHFNYY